MPKKLKTNITKNIIIFSFGFKTNNFLKAIYKQTTTSMSRILKDILTETKQGRTKYSQGRIYLFVSFTCFFLLNIVLAVGAVTGAIFEDNETLLVVSQNLRWALGTFGLYVLGGKGIGAFRDSQTGISNDYMHEANYPPYYGGGFPPYYGGGHHGPPYGGQQDPIDPSGGDSESNYHDGDNAGEGYYQQDDEEVL